MRTQGRLEYEVDPVIQLLSDIKEGMRRVRQSVSALGGTSSEVEDILAEIDNFQDLIEQDLIHLEGPEPVEIFIGREVPGYEMKSPPPKTTYSWWKRLKILFTGTA
jgi:hypothetical protein